MNIHRAGYPSEAEAGFSFQPGEQESQGGGCPASTRLSGGSQRANDNCLCGREGGRDKKRGGGGGVGGEEDTGGQPEKSLGWCQLSVAHRWAWLGSLPMES